MTYKVAHRWWDRLLAREDINGSVLEGFQVCPTYLIRRRLLRIGPWIAVYIHHFIDDDWSKDFHDHPKRFISIGLKGGYVEEIPFHFVTEYEEGDIVSRKAYIAPWIRSFPATHRHRIVLGSNGYTTWRQDEGVARAEKQDCWTLVIVGPKTREWGFWLNGKWMDWKEYVSDQARCIARRACP